MKHLLILGGGTAGTITANKLRKKLSQAEWDITVVDRDDKHDYQPGYLFIPFGIYQPDEVTKSRRKYLADDIPLIYAEIDRVDADAKTVSLVDGRVLPYDQLVIATGVTPRPDQTPGMDDEGSWYDSVFDFYTHAGATALAEKLKTWEGGRLVVNIVEMPIKCPVAPLEFTFLADAFFAEKGMRDKVEIVYVTPLDAAFTKPIAAKAFGTMLEDKGVRLEPEFMLERVDTEAKALVSYDEREVPYDLLVTIPLNMGADFVARSGLGNELNLVPVDKQTLLSKKYDSIFALGDANDIPASKAGSVAHFEIEGFVENFLAAHRRPRHDPQVRRPRQLLHRDRPRQGDAHRLQLRHRADAGQVPGAGRRPDEPAQGDQGQPPREARLPLGLLERPHARSADADLGRSADGRQEGARRLTGGTGRPHPTPLT